MIILFLIVVIVILKKGYNASKRFVEIKWDSVQRTLTRKPQNNEDGPAEVDQNPEYGLEDYNYYQASKVDNKNEYYGQNDEDYKTYIKDNNVDYNNK